MAAETDLGWEALRDRAAGAPSTPEVATLYARAFTQFGTAALWSRRPMAAPTLGEALVIAQALRREGGMAARRLALRIEDLCRAAL